MIFIRRLIIYNKTHGGEEEWLCSYSSVAKHCLARMKPCVSSIQKNLRGLGEEHREESFSTAFVVIVLFQVFVIGLQREYTYMYMQMYMRFIVYDQIYLKATFNTSVILSHIHGSSFPYQKKGENKGKGSCCLKFYLALQVKRNAIKMNKIKLSV